MAKAKKTKTEGFMKKFSIFFAFVMAVSPLCVKGIVAAEKQFHGIAVAYPPFTLQETTEHGMSWELSKAALKTQGYKAIIEFAPWGRAFSDSKNGKYDGVLIAYWTHDRSEYFVYPDCPIAFVTTGFFKKAGRTDITYSGDLRDISSLDIGVERGASMGELFDKADYLKKVFVNESQQLLKMVYLGRIDLGIAGFEYSRSNLRKIEKLSGFEGIRKGIEFITPPIIRRPAFLMISKTAPYYEQKLRDLNAGLKIIRTNGVFKKILKKYDIPETEYFPDN
jgi:polar amino acid transport system substrate-binding protein